MTNGKGDWRSDQESPGPSATLPSFAQGLLNGANIRWALGLLLATGLLWYFVPVSQAQLQTAQKTLTAQIETVKSDDQAKLQLANQQLQQHDAAIGEVKATVNRVETKIDKVLEHLAGASIPQAPASQLPVKAAIKRRQPKPSLLERVLPQ